MKGTSFFEYPISPSKSPSLCKNKKDGTGKLRIIHQNIAGLCSKSDRLEIFLSNLELCDKEADILCFTETNVKLNNEKNVNLRNFKLVSSYCRDDKSKGGSCILVKKPFNTKCISIPSDLLTKYNFECCGVEIIGLNVVVFCIYRIPGDRKSQVGSFLYKLDKLLNYATDKFKKKKIVICGDWNIDILKDNENSFELITILDSYNFEPHIRLPTRGNSCLDQIASNVKNVKSELHYEGLSDHETAQMVTLNVVKERALQFWFEHKRDYSKDNIKKFCDCLSSLSFSDVYGSHNFVEAFDNFYSTLLMFYNQCFPTIKVKITNKPASLKWITKGIRKSCKTKRHLYLKYRKISRDKTTNRLNYRKYDNILKKCIHKSQKLLNLKRIHTSKNKGKAIWNAITSSLTNCVNKNDIELINFNHLTYKNPSDISNILNHNFTILPLTQPLVNDNEPAHIQFNNPKTIFLKPVDAKEVHALIMSLNPSRTSGYDEISTNVLKACAKWICQPLSHIINLSFFEGVFPEQLKKSIVRPLFKKGDRADPSNYRPITLVPILSKIFEKAMLVRLLGFLDKHNILHEDQFGFRKNSSTALAGFNLIQIVTESINNGKNPVLALFMDLSKAFDYVDHCILLNKLDRYGIRGKALDWLNSYLKNRKQSTEITRAVQDAKKNFCRQNFRSREILKECGVPQGSILGPLLFLLFANDLPKSLSHKCILFADDTTVLIKVDKNDLAQQTLNQALREVVAWTNKNKLCININKTKFMQFNSYNTNPLSLDIEYNNQKVDEVVLFKFLGFTLDIHMNWKDHVNLVCQKLSRFIFALKRIRQTISYDAALAAYHGHVSSVLDYGLLLWGNSVDADKAFKMQKRCIRVINAAWFLDSCVPLYRKFKILPLPCMYIRDVCIFVKTYPKYFKKRSDVIPRQKREKFKHLLYQPPSHKDIYKKNICYMSIEIYNKLPDELKLLDGILFKKK
ncbi:hypothetical protein ABMA27_009630 [Loxostege sticticalis]|uniref:Reverse transcriptase domain-containing protein n=1 Tax=Loxostege sticticalis TaxID=481309 RepID=A0ABR3H8K5_LOXSC